MSDNSINIIFIIMAISLISEYVLISILTYFIMIQKDDASKSKIVIGFFSSIWPITYMVFVMIWMVSPKSKAVARILTVFLISFLMASCTVTKPVLHQIYHVRGTQFEYVKDNGDGTYAAYNLKTSKYISRIGFSHTMKPVKPSK